jgi:hypothetical protein
MQIFYKIYDKRKLDEIYVAFDSQMFVLNVFLRYITYILFGFAKSFYISSCYVNGLSPALRGTPSDRAS